MRQPRASERLASACPLDCPDACSLQVEVADGRVVALDGNRANPLTGGTICGKVRSGLPRQLYGPERLLRPGLRRGPKGKGEFSWVGWEAALERVAGELVRVREEFGGEAILPFSYGGSNGLLSQDTTDARLFRRLGASRLARTVCAAPTGRAAAGLYGKMPGVALQDYLHARLIVIWGANPAVSGIHLMPILQQARRRGAKLAVVDPRRTGTARLAEIHLPVRPGTDLPVALSILNWLFDSGRADESFLAGRSVGADELRLRAAPWSFSRAAAVAGVEAHEIEALARLYADSDPAVIRCGWGLERNRNGGSAVAAVLALPAVAGKFGVRGGGYTMSNSAAFPLRADRAAMAPEPTTRIINMNRLGRTLLETTDPPVKLLFVYNANPLSTLPEQQKVRRGLGREDLFTVVFEQVLTDTARYADVVLPAASFLERTEISRGYGAMVLQRAEAVAPAAGEARANHEVFAELCGGTGVARPADPESAAELEETLFGGEVGGTEADRRRGPPGRGDGPELLERLRKDGIVFPDFGATPVQFVDVFPGTADGKVHLVPQELDREALEGLYHYRPDPGTREYPLALISPASKRTISSTLGELRRDKASLQLHPRDAAARGISEGTTVRVFNELGEVICGARLNPELRPGVAYLPKGLWAHNTLNGGTANSLVPDSLADLGGGACFNDARVEVEAISAP